MKIKTSSLIALFAVLLAAPARAFDFDGRCAGPALAESLTAVTVPALATPFPVDTDPYVADQASDLIFNWLSYDANTNMPVLQAWMAQNGVNDSVAEFLFHKKYAGERARFVAELKPASVKRSTPFPVDTDPYLADQASDLIFNWLSADADANMPVLQAWLALNGVNDAVAEFMFHKKYAVQRAAFAATLSK